MENTQYIVALEISSSKIVGAIAEKSASGYVQVRHLEEVRILNYVRYGGIVNVENVRGNVARIIKKLENSIDGTITDVYVGLAGRSVHSVLSEVNRNLDPSEQITAEILEKIIRDAGNDPIKNYDTIDIVPREYLVDRKKSDNPVGAYGNNINITVNLIVAKPILKTNLSRALHNVTHVKGFLITPLVVAEEILDESELRLGVMLVDIGAETTTVAIYQENKLYYLTTLPLGGRNITLDIANGLRTVEESAERVKKNINNPISGKVESMNIDGINSAEAANYIEARAGEIVANITKQLEYANVDPTDLKCIVLVGGGGQLQGLDRLLSERTQLRVRMGTAPKTLNIVDHSINRSDYIEIFSLLSKAAEIIPEGQSCIERHNYEDGPEINEGPGLNGPEPEEQPKEEEKPETGKKKRKWWEKVKEQASQLLGEGDEGEFS